MGDKKRRLAVFLRQHPFCCFCGGVVPATTQDHLPPKSIFYSHKWPEGYVFPACLRCNSGSSADDALVGFLSRWNPGREPTPGELAEWEAQLVAFNEKHPAMAREMMASAALKRRWMENHGVEPPPGKSAGEMPLLKIPPAMFDAVERFNVKLTKALHYKSTGKIVPTDAWLFKHWWTNAHALAGEIPDEIVNSLQSQPLLRRGRISLLDQFSYKFSISDDGTMGIYTSTFRSMFLLLGMVSFDASKMKDVDTSMFERQLVQSVPQDPA